MEGSLPRGTIDVAGWSDLGSREALDLVAASVAEMVGFEVAVISVVRGDQMYAVTVEGTPEAAAAMLGVPFRSDEMMAEIARGESWGRFWFVGHEAHEMDFDTAGWVPDIEPIDAEDAWDPMDFLGAPLFGPDGRLIGLLSIDLPISRRRPGPAQRVLLERYAVQAERVLRMAVERDELSERIRLVEAARRVVRFATSQDDLESVLDDCRHPLLEGFRADFLAIRTYPSQDLPSAGSPPTGLSDATIETIRAAVRVCWAEQRVLVVGPEPFAPGADPTLDDRTLATVLEATHQVDMATMMVVPLGAGRPCFGHLILGRRDATLRWSEDEQASALEITRDIGQAVANSRRLAREQRLAAELRQLSSYKTEVLNTVSHELKNPLGAVTGHLEMLQVDAGFVGANARALDAIERATTRMRDVVDDLLVLARVEDPGRTASGEVCDASAVLLDALDLGLAAAQRKGLAVDVSAPAGELLVHCPAPDLDRVLGNLVGNAVKYTPEGRSIEVSLIAHPDDGEVELAVVDQGIGISEDDQERLFSEFFRSTNPEALRQPGTGLGLTICRRILEHHGGRIQVHSTLGFGSTFRAFLRAA